MIDHNEIARRHLIRSRLLTARARRAVADGRALAARSEALSAVRHAKLSAFYARHFTIEVEG